MRIRFLGAIGEVTGSCYLLEAAGCRFLVDCGMFQGGREARAKNAAALAFDPGLIDFVILTHAHIDHSGLVPRLVSLGYRGPVYATDATRALLEIMLPDSGHLQENEAERVNRYRHARMHGGNHGDHGKHAHPSGRHHEAPAARRHAEADDSDDAEITPLYTVQQAITSLRSVHSQPYDRIFSPAEHIRVRFNDAGHILGAAIAEVWVREGERESKLVFSGDIGQPGQPLLRDPVKIADADTLLIESTYGNRLHRSLEETERELVEVVSATLKRGGNVIVPAFAVGRTQEMLYLLTDLVRRGRLPRLNVFVDSPMATAATQLTATYARLLDREAKDLFAWARDNPQRINIHFTSDVEESKALNKVRAGAIIVSASGMCDAGRIVHHLYWNLPREQCAVLITGFQAAGTLGRRIVDGAASVRLLGEDVPVRASVHTLGGLSAHADQAGLLDWLRGFQTPPRHTFVVHGEAQTAQIFAQTVRDQLGWTDVVLPEPQVSYEI